MSSIVAGALLGLALGVRHSLEPDHLAAVGTFVSRTEHPRRAAAVGTLWGVGHSAALLVLGAIVLAVRGSMPGWIDCALELLVGVMLVLLGARTMLVARSERRAIHGNDHASAGLGPFAVGLGHGVAGTGAAVLLATATMPDPQLGVLFLGLFAAGSIAGMALLAGIVSVPMRRAASSRRRHVLAAAGLLSIAIGLWWVLSAATELVAP